MAGVICSGWLRWSSSVAAAMSRTSSQEMSPLSARIALRTPRLSGANSAILRATASIALNIASRKEVACAWPVAPGPGGWMGGCCAIGDYLLPLLPLLQVRDLAQRATPVYFTHLRAHETDSYLVCRLLLEKKKK